MVDAKDPKRCHNSSTAKNRGGCAVAEKNLGKNKVIKVLGVSSGRVYARHAKLKDTERTRNPAIAMVLNNVTKFHKIQKKIFELESGRRRYRRM